MHEKRSTFTARMRAILLITLLFRLISPAVSPAGQEPEVPETGLRLERIYFSFDEFRGVEVRVVEGVARLGGSVNEPSDAERAEEIAQSLGSVDYVINEIEVSAEVPRRLEPLLNKLSEALNRAWDYLPVLGLALAVFLVFLLLAALLARWNWLFSRLSFGNPLMRTLLIQLGRTLVVIIGLVVVLDLLGLAGAVGAVIGAAGLFGLVLGFGLREIVENYISGILLSIRSPFSLEDWVGVGEHEGSVLRMTSRELVLMNLSGNHIRIPNTEVFKSIIYNYTRNPLRMFRVDVGVGTQEDLRGVQKTGVGALARMKGVLDDPPPFMRTQELGDFNVTVSFFGWVDQRSYDYLKVRSEAVRLIKEAMDAAKIDMPVPSSHLTLRKVVPDLEAEPEAAGPDVREVLDRAEAADVERETYLDRQIESDRSASREEDLLTKKER